MGSLRGRVGSRLDGPLLVAGGWAFLMPRDAFYMACKGGKTDVVRRLIAEGADPNTVDQGFPALFGAAQYGHTAAVKLLLAANASVDAPNTDGTTPLFFAAENGHTAALELLLAAKAGVDTPKKDGATPLFVAAFQGHLDVVRLLLLGGADPTKEWRGQTPLASAEKKGRAATVALLRDPPQPLPLRAAEGRLALATSCNERLGDGSPLQPLPFELLACIGQHVQHAVLCACLGEARMVVAFLASCAGADDTTARTCLGQASWDAPLAIERFLAPPPAGEEGEVSEDDSGSDADYSEAFDDGKRPWEDTMGSDDAKRPR